MKLFSPGLLFAGKLFLMTYFISLLVTSLSKLSVFLIDSVLAGCVFQETCPFLLSCLFYWCVVDLVLLGSGIQQNDSAIHVCIFILFSAHMFL